MSMFAMEPRILLIVRLQRYLEQLLECPVDVIHMHKHINPYLLKDINRDGIYVIGEITLSVLITIIGWSLKSDRRGQNQ